MKRCGTFLVVLLMMSTVLIVSMGTGWAQSSGTIADRGNHRIQKVTVQQGTQRTIKVNITATAKIQVGPFQLPVTIPIDSTEFLTGETLTFPQVDLSSFGEQGAQLQPVVDALVGTTLLVPDGAIDHDITVNVDIRNIDATDLENIHISPIIVNGDTIPVFFFIRMSVESDGVLQERFDFNDGFPLVLKLPLDKFIALLQASGFTDVPFDRLALAFVTPTGLTREGIFSSVEDSLLITSITHLSDLVGIDSEDIPLPSPPAIIEGPSVVPDTSSALVLWKTDTQATSVVVFGTTPALGDTVSNKADSSGVTEHQVLLEELQKATWYYYQVLSTDPFGQTVASALDSFKTLTVPDIAAPIITLGPFDLDVTPTSALIFWETDKHATSTVQYGTTTALENIVTDETLDLEHEVPLAGLEPNTQYYYQVSSTGSGTVTSDTLTFTTSAALDTLPPVIIAGPTVDSYGVTDTTAIVTWETDVASNSQVWYWEAGMTDTMVVFNPALTTEHAVTLTHLMPDTPYEYFVRSTRPSNNESVVSPTETFRTLPAGEVVDLQFIVSPHIVYQTDTRVIFEWTTNTPSDGFVYYMPDPTESGVFSLDESLVRGRPNFTLEHRVNVSGLTPGTPYLFVVTSSAPSGDFLIWPPGTVFAKPIVVGGRLVPTGILQVPGSTGRFTTNSQPDTQAPVILNGPTVVAQTAARLVLQWETDEISTSVVNYGIESNLTNTVQDPQQVTLHRITLTNLITGTTYNYQVSSTDPSNNGPTQSSQSVAATAASADVTAPVIDPASIIASPSDTRATIRWTTDEAATSEVRFGTHPDNLNTTVTDPTAVTSHVVTVTGLTASRLHYYRVYSADVSGNGPTPSATQSFTTQDAPDTVQPAISSLQKAAVAKADISATLTLTWTTDKLATSFVDYDTLSTLATKITIGDQTGTVSHSLSATKLILGKRYYFKVGSVNVNDTRVPAPSTLSALDSLTMPASVDATLPSTPASVVAFPGNGAVRLRWAPSTDISGIAGYNLTRNGVAFVSNVADTTYLDYTVTNGTAYSYAVAAVDKAGNIGAFSSAAAATPNTTQVPTAPTAVATPDTVSLKPVLILGDATPVAGDASRATLTYTFQVADDSAFTALTITKAGIAQGTVSNPTHWQVLDTGRPDSTALADGTRYWWRARAQDGVFEGDWSATRTFVASTSKPVAVELATFTATEERGVVTVLWTVARAQDQAGFHVYRSLRPQDGFEKLTPARLAGGKTFQFIDRGVQVNQVYYYQLEAVSPSGQPARFGPLMIRVSAPRVFALHQNYPNPFNPETTIRFDVPTTSVVTLKVYNLLGQEVVTLLDGEPKEAGYYTLRWNGRSRSGERVASGLYFYRLAAGTFVKTRKMTLVK